MASYKNRVQELEQALRAIRDLSHIAPNDTTTDLRVACGKVHRVAMTMLAGGLLGDAKLTKTVRNFMSGQLMEIPLDTPYCCDPSTEAYWSN